MTDNDGYHHMQYDRLSPVLLEAIKELKQEVDLISARLASLEEKNAIKKVPDITVWSSH